MSRSYKKNPILKSCPKDGTYGKRQANKRVRRFKDEISDGKEYRKLYCTWNIHDSVSRYTLNDALQHWGEMVDRRMWWGIRIQYVVKTETIQTAIKRWKKFYYWK